MTKSEKKDKKAAMEALNISVVMRGAFMHWANRWGRFNLNNDQLWYEWSPLEDRSKATKTMAQMWGDYQNRHCA
jgi:hypothetical protein